MKKLFLSVLFILSLTGVVLASDLSNLIRTIDPVSSYSEDDDIDSVYTVTFGSYPQSSSGDVEPIEWVVLAKKDNKALLLSKYILDNKKYNNSKKDITWENCTLRDWLNGDFYNIAFSSSEKRYISSTNISNQGNSQYGTSGGNSTNDKVFILSKNEITKYFGNENSDSELQLASTRGTDYAINNGLEVKGKNPDKWYYGRSYYMLRTPGTLQSEVAGVWNSGGMFDGDFAVNEKHGVRPAMWVDLSISDNVGTYEENSDYMDDNSNIDDDTYEDYVEDEIPEDYSNAGNMTKSDTVTLGINGIEVTFKRADLKQGWVNDVEGRKFYFNSYDPIEESAYLPNEGWKEIDGKYYYFTDHGYILTNTTTPDGYKVDRNGVLIEEVQETTKVPETTKPAPKNGWYGDYYYQNDVMITNNWVEYNGDFYYCGPSGAILKNQWIEKTYYVDSTGKMLKNTTTPDGNKVGADGKYIPDEIIDLDARKNTNKQEETKKQETKEKSKSKIEKQETQKSNAGIGITTEREPYILSDDGSEVTFQITARTSAGVHAELYVTDPGYEYSNGLFDKTHAEVCIDVAYSLLTNKDRETLSKISNSTVCAVDDGVGGKYDYSMAKKTGPCINNNQIILPTISRKEATRIVNELNKKLDNDEKIIIKVQYAEHDTTKGKYAANPIYIGKGKVVVKKEGLIFKSLSMYVEFEGEAKKKLEEYTRKNKGKYLYLTDSLVDDGSGYVDEVKYFDDDEWLQELTNKMNDNSDREDYHTLQVITKTISDGKVHVNLLGNPWADKDPKIFSDADIGYEYALRNASGFPTNLYIIDGMENYTK